MFDLTLIVASSVLVGYAVYVTTLVIQADFYTRGQKLAQCLLILLLPLLGALLVHWFFRLQQAQPAKPDRNFVPQQDSNIDEVQALHRHIDAP